MSYSTKALYFLIFFICFPTFGQQMQLQWGIQSRGDALGGSGSMITTVTDNCIDSQGNILVVGNLNGNADFDPSANNFIINSSFYNIFFAKYTPGGALVWVKQIKGDMDPDITIDNANNIIISGSFQSIVDLDPSSGTANHTSQGQSDVFIAKYDNNGNYIWSKSFGGAEYDYERDLEVDASGNIVLTGEFRGTVDFDPSGGTTSLTSIGLMDIFFTKFNSNGDFIWAKAIGSDNVDYVHDIKINSNSDIFLTGYFQPQLGSGPFDSDPSGATYNLTSNGGRDGFLSKFDSNGNFTWAFNFGASGYGDEGQVITFDNQNNVILSGVYSSVCDFDPSAGVFNLTSNGFQDAFISKYTNMGGFVSAYSLSGTNSENIREIIYANNNYYVFGDFVQTVNFNITGGTSALTASSRDMFIAKYANDFSLSWVYNMDDITSGNEYSVGGIVNPALDEIYLVGKLVSGSIDVDPSSAVYSLTAGTNGGTEMIICKYKDCNTPTPTAASTQYLCFMDAQLQNVVVNGTNIIWYDSPTNGNIVQETMPLVDGSTYYASQVVDGCESENRVAVTIMYNDPVLNDVVQHSTCYAYNNGQIQLYVTSPSGSPSYTYQWTPAVSNGPLANSLSPNDYNVIVTASNGCYTYANFTIYEPNEIGALFSAVPSNCSGTCTGELFCDPYGGTSGYTMQWNSMTGNQTDNTAIGLCPGSYEVLITDVNGCTGTASSTVPPNSSVLDNQIFLTNIAAVDQSNVSPSFSAYYNYNLPTTITPHPSNTRNFVDPGKRARFKVESKNQKSNGQSVVSGICKVRTNNQYVTITDTSSALNNIGWGDFAWSADEFEININPTTPPGTNLYIDFIIQENGIEYPTTCIPIPITPLVYSPTTSLTIDDDNNPDSQGNDNDICEPGETIEFYPWLDNISTLNAEYVRGRLENLDNHAFIDIWNGVPGVGTTVYDATWWNYSFAQPQMVPATSLNTTPEYDFVFDYSNGAVMNDFNLYLVVAGGFNLFNSNSLSLVQWSLPYTFHNAVSAETNEINSGNYGLILFPNPTDGSINLILKDKEINSVALYDLFGRSVYFSEVNTNEIDLSNYSSGVYHLVVESKGRIYEQNIVKK